MRNFLYLSAKASGVAPVSSSGGANAAMLGSTGSGANIRGDGSSAASKPKIRRVAVMTTGGRGRTARGVIVGSRPLIPASAVPEDLIAQVYYKLLWI